MESLSEEDQGKYNLNKNKLNLIGGRIKTIVEQGRSIASDPSNLFLFKGMYKELKPYFDSFNDVWDQQLSLLYGAGIFNVFPNREEKGLQQAVERYYYEANAIYEEHMNPTPSMASRSLAQNSTLNESRTVRARLPQINLPDFNGNPLDWPLFRDTYRSLIHEEPSLSDMEKFIFLISCLKGPARTLVSNVNLLEENYAQAWRVLNEHYNDKRRLATNYLKQVLEFKPFTGKPTATSLKHLLTTVVEAIDSFRQLKVSNADDFILLFLLLRCLDNSTRREFEKQYANVEFPTYKNLIDFLKVEWRSMDMTISDEDHKQPHMKGNQSVGQKQTSSNFRSKHSFFVGKDGRAERSSTSSSRENPRQHTEGKPQQGNFKKEACPVCGHEHTLYQCSQFRRLPAREKLASLENWSGCKNCLSSRHTSNLCTSMRRCQVCNKSHHTWLHQTIQPAELIQPNQSSTGVTLGSLCSEGEVLLGTAIVQIKNAAGDYVNMRLVTDSGSQYSFVTEECVTRLGLTVEPSKYSISGIGQVPLGNTKGSVKCTIRSILPSFACKELSTNAIVVAKVTQNLPQVSIPSQLQDIYKGYTLSDINFWKSGPVDFLLGGDLFFDILNGPPITVQEDIPKLLPTLFGFIVAGRLKYLPRSLSASSFFIESREELGCIMSRFWEMEEVIPVNIPSEEDDYVERHFQETHYRLESGRYVVSLPFKESIATLQNTEGQALKRLMTLESKLSKDNNLKEEYSKFMSDYISLGHMKEVATGTARYTLPHHAVVKWQSGQMKLRTVFDASCKSTTGSLNEHMYTGPKLQLDIAEVINNFRNHVIVFTTDIVKMYRQILVHPPDRQYQHVLWRTSPSDAVKEYELCTITYGESSAPFCAQRTLRQLVQDEGSPYPYASKALIEDTYVDDVVSGANTEEDALRLQAELIELLKRGGFELSKWASNSPKLLRSIRDTELQVSAVDMIADEEFKVKLLGMQWIPNHDMFTYEISTPPWHPSKRAVLSAIARIYDPIGFLSPVVFYAKVILQDMWISKVDWDDLGPPEICSRWHKFVSQLNALSDIRIPRSIVHKDSVTTDIIGFSDASERGYSAVLYLRTTTSTKNHVQILKAKTKLAPIKTMTIPRLELSGALLLVRLFRSCDKIISNLQISKCQFYTDSEIVLGWLASPPHRLKTFVANRVVEILEDTTLAQWKHVPGEENPADCSSRGLSPAELQCHTLWWSGPEWLKCPSPEEPYFVASTDNLPEMKGNKHAALVAREKERNHFLQWMERFSSYTKLLLSVARVLRFIKRVRFHEKTTGPVTVKELREATKLCLKVTQSEDEIRDKSLQNLRPFRDHDGILRVGGRLENSNLEYNRKHPVLLSRRSHMARLLVDHYHLAYLHLGPTALQAILQGQFWIVSARKLIRQRIYNCITCFKRSRSPQAPVMGSLPPSRVEDGQVFNHVGVDFGGPFTIRESLRRKAALGKAYLCLFICMATRAVHLEVVSSLSTEAFLASLDRFISRRGRPIHIYSDCGTNFVGASNKLKELHQWYESSQTNLAQQAALREIKWSFNPPSAPHFGGLWEAGIKSAKAILQKSLGEATLTFEELTTVFCKIEGILNSRPLSPLSSEGEVIECLTPGHFLTGRLLLAAPEENILNDKISPLKRWHIIKQQTQHFWARWRKEYLHQLQQRRKWTTDRNNLKEGDLVIIKEPNCPQKIWPLARVITTHPGTDGVVRVVTIRTSTGTYKRPVTKLVPLLPINECNIK